MPISCCVFGVINADVNGSGNIIRKVVPNAFADGIEGVVVRPLRFTFDWTGKRQEAKN